ncbi:MAG TPA: hypothetical protein PLT92_14290 [Ignavibacteriaceae bacterium]|nr:hypothetical protein [Ignavibacteriaceae bacterium]
MQKFLSFPDARKIFTLILLNRENATDKENILTLKYFPIQEYSFNPLDNFRNAIKELNSDSDERDYWMALCFQANANLTLSTSESCVIQQFWELKEEILLKNEREDQRKYTGIDSKVCVYYRFCFIGYNQFGTMKYNNEELFLPSNAFHQIVRIFLNESEDFRDKFYRIVGLEYLKYIKLMRGYGISWLSPQVPEELFY